MTASGSDPIVVGVGWDLRADLLEMVRRGAAAGGRAADIRPLGGSRGSASDLSDLEVLFGGLGPEQASRARRLRWLHAPSAGVDSLPLAQLGAAGVLVTNSRGLYDEAMAEHALALLLSLVRRIPEAVRDQQGRRWHPHPPETLAGTRVGVLGFGSIGRAIARRVAAFGAEIWGLRAHPRSDPLAARMFGASPRELREFLAGCGSVVAVVPSTPATRGLLDAEALAAMPRGARLVNLGRADLIVEAALDAALRAGHLSGAGLDCPPRDPLPPDSPLWTAPGALITPHIGGQRADNETRTVALFAANLTRYCRGEPLENRVDLEAGY